MDEARKDALRVDDRGTWRIMVGRRLAVVTGGSIWEISGKISLGFLLF